MPNDRIDVDPDAMQLIARELDAAARQVEAAAATATRARAHLRTAPSEHRATRALDHLERAHRHLADSSRGLWVTHADVQERHRTLMRTEVAEASRAYDQPGQDTDVQKLFLKIRDLLVHSTEGKRLLELFGRFRIHMRISKKGRGTYYDPNNNTMYIERSGPLIWRALGFVHEMIHAEREHTNQTADAYTMSRRDYITAMLREEAHAAGTEAEVEDQLEQAHVDNPDRLSSSAGVIYHNAHEKAYRENRDAHPQLTNATLKSVARAAGERAIFNAIRRGDIVPSVNEDTTYWKLYGDYWDDVHGGG